MTPFFHDYLESCDYFAVELRDAIGGEVVLGAD